MNGFEVSLQVGYRARVDETIEESYARFFENMQKFGPPLGLQGLEPPIAPLIRLESGDLSGLTWYRYPIKGLKLQMTALFRHETHIGRDKAGNDDRISIDFKTSNNLLDYSEILRNHFPKVIEAYRGYRARVLLDRHWMKYADAYWNEWSGRETTNPTFHRLEKDPSIDVDGRNNIYTLHPAVFWDAELCRRALGYDPDEVMRRLDGQVVLMKPLLDGVYIVFNDDPALSYESFVLMNERFKQVLGIE